MSDRVQKFRSVEEMNRAAAPDLSATDAFDRFARQCARIFALAERSYPRGVFKFRSIEEAQAARARVGASKA